MDIYEALTELDKERILNYIHNVGEGSLSSSRLPDFLSSWANAKEPLYHIFDDKFIISKKITYAPPEDALCNAIRDVITNYSAFFEYLRLDIKKLLYTQDISWAYDFCDTIFYFLKYPNTIAKNTIPSFPSYVSQARYDIPTPQGNRIRVAPGAKPMRILGKLARAFGYEAQYEEFRIEISRCLNISHLEGELCLSIHPLDYMTMSDNDCDWHSCMAWTNNGEYKQGTLEMLGSPYCVVAYLTAKEPFNFNFYADPTEGSTWNNKKWRQLLFIHPAFIVGNRHYPYNAPGIEEMAMNWLKELAEKANFSQYENKLVDLTTHSAVVVDEREISMSLSMDQMYNDLDKNRYYLATNFNELATHSSSKDNYYYLQVHLSGPAHCIDCGEPIYDPFDPSILKCNDCQPHFICSCCDEGIIGDPEYTNSSGETFCYDCLNYSDRLTECDICDELYFDEGDTFFIEDEVGNSVSHVCLCNCCLDKSSYITPFGALSSGTFNAEETTLEGHDILAEHYKDFSLDEELEEDF